MVYGDDVLTSGVMYWPVQWGEVCVTYGPVGGVWVSGVMYG